MIRHRDTKVHQEKQASPVDKNPPAARARVLVFGGTQESAPLAQALLERGCTVLVSTATDAPLALPLGAERRSGRLDAPGIAALVMDRKIEIIIDAGHPYAVELHRDVLRGANLAGIPCLRYTRNACAHHADDQHAEIHQASTHEEAAILACRLGRRVLLTTGSRNLDCYVREAAQKDCLLFARVLDHPESLEACIRAGLAPDKTFAQRGPFSFQDNLALLESTGADVLVTKDSGSAGGVEEKLAAARQKGIPIVMVKRPDSAAEAASLLPFSDFKELIAHLDR